MSAQRKVLKKNCKRCPRESADIFWSSPGGLFCERTSLGVLLEGFLVTGHLWEFFWRTSWSRQLRETTFPGSAEFFLRTFPESRGTPSGVLLKDINYWLGRPPVEGLVFVRLIMAVPHRQAQSRRGPNFHKKMTFGLGFRIPQAVHNLFQHFDLGD